eukprot:CAMPEP_0118952808 /NCGR_PEP_ID=MMETSP1169-20130426/55505_1 /TAXON_ID=36882 /ORGANISM="Pyramimonas obovata, Strain CCMP722" /LENGTH=46 /DNA_ID= /DNA_START= /DNA_END= /DNA_ORIENTATION=
MTGASEADATPVEGGSSLADKAGADAPGAATPALAALAVPVPAAAE